MEDPNITYVSTNNNGLLNNRQFIEMLYVNVVNGLKRPISNGERNWMQNFIRQENPVKFRNKTPQEILKAYTKFFIDRFSKNNCSYDGIDTHELNKSQIGIQSEITSSDFGSKAKETFSNEIVSNLGAMSISKFLGEQDLNNILSKISPSAIIKTESIILDTRYRSLDNNGTLFFRWNAIYDDSDIQGGFNINQRVRDVISIKCFPIKMPYVSTADNDYGRVSLLFQEFQSQSFVAHENSKFHFIFATDVEDRWIHLRAHNYNDGIYRFATPLTQLSTLTISFGSPLQPVVFDLDRMFMSIRTTPTGYSTKTYFESSTNHNLETGDLVYISNFNTLNPIANSTIINNINSRYGNKCTFVDNTTIYFDINSSPIYISPATGQLTVTNGSDMVVGVGTTFITSPTEKYFVGDNIRVNGQNLIIKSIISNTNLQMTTNYIGANGTFPFELDNRISNLQVQAYFGSKRIFMEFEISYIDKGLNHV
jgi:hypothetical protein